MSITSPAQATASSSVVRPPSAGVLPSPWMWVGVASVERRPAETSSPVREAPVAWVVKPCSLVVTILILTCLSLTASLRGRQVLFALVFGDGQQFFSLVNEARSDEAVAICFEMHWIRPPASVIGLQHLAQVDHRQVP